MNTLKISTKEIHNQTKPRNEITIAQTEPESPVRKQRNQNRQRFPSSSGEKNQIKSEPRAGKNPQRTNQELKPQENKGGIDEPVHEDIGVICEGFAAKEARIQEMRVRVFRRGGGGGGEAAEAPGAGEEAMGGDGGVHVGERGEAVVFLEEAGSSGGLGGIHGRGILVSERTKGFIERERTEEKNGNHCRFSD